ncbi:MAG: hypothetical protein AAFZ67_00425 [Planctomycetota bacterium]
MRTSAALAVVLAAGVSASAVAQMVTPAPPPKPEEEYTPPPQREPVRPVARPAEPAEPAFDPTTVEFEPIFSTGDDGTIVHPEGAVEYAAIRNNPLIDDDVRFLIDELLIERDAKAEAVVIGSPREAIELGLGIVETMDFGDRTTVENIARVAQELQMGGGAIADLANQGVLTDQARAMSVHIWQTYNQAVTAELTARFEGSEEPNALLNAQSRYLMGASMQEIDLAFDRVARRALERLDNPEAGTALNLEGVEFRRVAAAILDRLSDERLAKVFQ